MGDYAIRPLTSTREKHKQNFIKQTILNDTHIRRPINHLTSIVSNYAKSLAIKSIKDHFGFEIRVSSRYIGSPGYIEFIKWIKKRDKNFDHHIHLNGKEEILQDCEFILPLTKKRDTFLYIASTNNIAKYKSINDIFASQSDQEFDSISLYMYVFGKKSYYFQKTINYLLNKNSKTLTTFKVSGEDDYNTSFKVISSDMNRRNFDTIFLENDIIGKIKDHIDKFNANESVYKQRSLLYKTGILFEGEPGTGKTSLANAIANEYGYDLIIVDMNDFNNIDSVSLADTINADNERYIVLLEDIDCVVRDREDESTDKEDRKIINRLLQFLDSNSSPTNVIFIATTNHPEKLDSAIKRDGRFDLIVSIRGIYKENAIKMCKSFAMTDQQIDTLIGSIESFPINQSKLQNMILKSLEAESVTISDEEV